MEAASLLVEAEAEDNTSSRLEPSLEQRLDRRPVALNQRMDNQIVGWPTGCQSGRSCRQSSHGPKSVRLRKLNKERMGGESPYRRIRLSMVDGSIPRQFPG